MASLTDRARDIRARYQMGMISLQQAGLEYMELFEAMLALIEPQSEPAQPPAQYKMGDSVTFQEHPDEHTIIELDGFVIRSAWNITHREYEYTIESKSSPWQMPQFHIVPERDIMGIATTPSSALAREVTQGRAPQPGRVRVRILRDVSVRSVEPAGVRHFHAGEVCELIPRGGSWWDSYDIDGAFILPDDAVEVLEPVDDDAL